MHHLNVHASKLALILGIIIIFTKPSLHRRTCEREWRVKNCLSSRNDHVNTRHYVYETHQSS